MSKPSGEETSIAVHHRTLEEIAWYLQTMQGFPSKQVAVDAASAWREWRNGNREPAKNVITRWYQTLKQDTDHTLTESCAEPLDMEEAIGGKDMRVHMDLLVQMIVTLESQ